MQSQFNINNEFYPTYSLKPRVKTKVANLFNPDAQIENLLNTFDKLIYQICKIFNITTKTAADIKELHTKLHEFSKDYENNPYKIFYQIVFITDALFEEQDKKAYFVKQISVEFDENEEPILHIANKKFSCEALQTIKWPIKQSLHELSLPIDKRKTLDSYTVKKPIKYTISDYFYTISQNIVRSSQHKILNNIFPIQSIYQENQEELTDAELISAIQFQLNTWNLQKNLFITINENFLEKPLSDMLFKVLELKNMCELIKDLDKKILETYLLANSSMIIKKLIGKSNEKYTKNLKDLIIYSGSSVKEKYSQLF